MDIYQKRYLAHQKRKFAFLRDNRRSRRVFTKEHLTKAELEYIREAIKKAPSSCNRKGIEIKTYRKSINKKKLEEFLVGGREWLGKADVIILLFANMLAYKSPNEVDYMPYLDAGIIASQVYMAAEAIGIGMCFVNPNTILGFREEYNKKKLRFCGAIALGNYNKEPK